MPAFAPRFTITNSITAGLTAIERARGFLGSGDVELGQAMTAGYDM
jgi:hypothetical protein